MKRLLRNIEKTSNVGKIDNIDYIYLINLDHRPEKLRRSLLQLEPFSIRPERVSAIYGWHLTTEAVINMALHFEPWMDGGSKQLLQPIPYPGRFEMRPLDASCVGMPCFYPRTSLGAIGCAMSHLSVLQDAYESGYETIWILEDDFMVAKDPHLLSALVDEINQVEGGWDLFYTDDRNYFNEPFTPGTVWRPDAPSLQEPFLREPTGSFVRISGRSQTHSMVLHRSGIEKILEFYSNRGLFLPYDIDTAFVPDIRMFNLKQEIVWGGIWTKEISDTDFRHF